MRKEEQDNDVRLAATQALYNAIEFASTNFRNETERNYLMQVLLPQPQWEWMYASFAYQCVLPLWLLLHLKTGTLFEQCHSGTKSRRA